VKDDRTVGRNWKVLKTGYHRIMTDFPNDRYLRIADRVL
jgi:hypothetical protein